MSVIAEVKCARCDRKYSGLRSKCPYCGARRIGRGKYAEEADNSKGKMLVGVLIMAVLVVAAGVLLFTTPKDDPLPDIPRPGNSSESSPPPTSTDPSGGIFSMPGASIEPSKAPDDEDVDETPSPSPSSEVTLVQITYSNRSTSDFTAGIGERVPLRARIEPATASIDEDIEWTSSDTSVFNVVKTNTEGTNATVTGIGVGTATLTVTVGGQEATCIVRVR